MGGSVIFSTASEGVGCFDVYSEFGIDFDGHIEGDGDAVWGVFFGEGTVGGDVFDGDLVCYVFPGGMFGHGGLLFGCILEILLGDYGILEPLDLWDFHGYKEKPPVFRAPGAWTAAL